MNNKLTVSLSPHIRSKDSIPKIMYSVIGALLPAWAVSIYFFGIRALTLTLIGMVTAVATEWIIQKLRKVPITAFDGSAALTGLLVTFNVPPGVSWWIPVVGAFFAIAFAKQAFGGLGYNPVNPALAGRAFLMASWPVQMTTRWLAPHGGTLSGFAAKSGIDAMTGATPLTAFKLSAKDIIANIDPQKVEAAHNTIAGLYHASIPNLIIGNVGGVIGETSAIALLIGALYLFLKKYADWRIPTGYIATVAVLGWIFGGAKGLFTGNVLFQLFSGGLFLGALFMATDMVTSPITPKGRWIFGVGCGILTVVIRKWGGYPEGVSYSILLMNLAAPIIDRHTKPKTFGK